MTEFVLETWIGLGPELSLFKGDQDLRKGPQTQNFGIEWKILKARALFAHRKGCTLFPDLYDSNSVRSALAITMESTSVT